MSEKVRLNVEAVSKKINDMKDATGIKTNQTLIDNALLLFEWAINQKKEGWCIGSVMPDSKDFVWREVLLPAIENVKESKK